MASDICDMCVIKGGYKLRSILKYPRKKGKCLFCGGKGFVRASSKPKSWIEQFIMEEKPKKQAEKPAKSAKKKVVSKPKKQYIGGNRR
jgi:hypothetical protein